MVRDGAVSGAIAPLGLLTMKGGVSRHLHTLMPQQPALAFDTAAIAGECAIGADQAMAGHNDAQGVRSIGVADGPHRRWGAELYREAAVAARGAGGDFAFYYSSEMTYSNSAISCFIA